MGNPLKDAATAIGGAACIRHFYTNASWIEGSAVDQLNQVAALPGVSNIAAFPDLHPGKFGPVGCAVLADRIYPQLIGNDIGCGMSLFVLDIQSRKLRLDKAADQLRALEGPPENIDHSALESANLPAELYPNQLGTIGGGNHFCELQAVQQLFGDEHGLEKDQAYLLVHSGSRALGSRVFETVAGHQNGLTKDSDELQNYLEQHNQAVRWASLNRQIIALRAARALRAECKLVSDAPHNVVEHFDGQFLHRKGAAKADIPLVPLAGSRDALSYLLAPTGAEKGALNSLAHGSGRKYDRRSMHGRVSTAKSERDALARNSFGGRIVCEDRQLLVEEAPNAYKNSSTVLHELQSFRLANAVASFKPLVTFKKADLGLSVSASQHDSKGRKP